MTDPENDRLELIRKLLAKAEGTTNEAERDAFNEKAAELIAKYGIEAALLANDGKTRDVVGDRIVVIDAPYMTDKSILLNNIALPLRVKAVRRDSTRTATRLEMHLFGFAADLERVEILYTSLLLQATFGLASVRPTRYYAQASQSVAAYRRSWFAGFSAEVNHRLLAAEKRAQREADAARTPGQPGTDLVLADRNQQVAARVAEEYPR